MTSVTYRRKATTAKCLTCGDQWTGPDAFGHAELHAEEVPGHDTEVYMTEIARITSPAAVSHA